MAKPWERYQQQAPDAAQMATGKPWERFGGSANTTTLQPAPESADAKGNRLPTKIGSAGLAGLYAQGGSFGASDELLGAATGLVDAGMAALGYDPNNARGPASVENGDGITTATMGTPRDMTVGERISENIDNERRALRQARDESGATGTAAEFIGAAAGAGGRAVMNAGRSVLGGQVGRGALEGGAAGAAAGAGYAEGGLEDRAEGATFGGVGGAIFGSLFPAAAGAMRRAGGARAVARAAPEVDALRAQSKALFDRVEQSGARISYQAYDDMVRRLMPELRSAGIDPTLTPKAVGAFQRLAGGTANPPSFEEIQILRRVLGTAAESVEPSERKLAGIMMDHLDDFVENLTQADLSAGRLGSEAQDLVQARQLWGRMRRTEMIQGLINRADLAASGIENGLRTEFRNLLRAAEKDSRKLRGFTADEIEAMRNVANGTRSRNFLRFIGTYSPNFGRTRNALGAAMGISGGYALGGPIGAAVLPVATIGARSMANRGTSNAANLVRNMVASGITPQTAASPSLLSQAITGLVARGAPVEGGSLIADVLRDR